MNILTYAPNVGDATSFYRLAGVIPYLSLEYSEIKVKDISTNQHLDWYDFTGQDIFIFQRPCNKYHFAAIKMARNMGLKIVIDYDDNLFNIPQENPVYITFEPLKETMKSICSIADEIWVSTEAIKETLSKFNERITVIPNAHNDYLLPLNKKKDFNLETKKVAYRGGITHEVDVYSKASEWSDIINNNKDFQFYFLGARFPYLESICGSNYNVMVGMHIIDYFKFFYELNPNILIYTLEDNLFNKSKSNISWIEATYAGAAVIAPGYLPEFSNKFGIVNYRDSMSELFNSIKGLSKQLAILNDISWKYIKQNLLLSEINTIRYKSLLRLKNN